MKRLIPLIIIVLWLNTTGCTTQSTRLAIENYHAAENHKQLAFNNTLRISKEQMLLNLAQYIRANSNDQEKILHAVQITWKARDEVEECRVQYIYGRILTMTTVGPYLYDQQGAINALASSASEALSRTSESLNAAKDKSGFSIKDLVPAPPSTTQPSVLDRWQQYLNELNQEMPKSDVK